MATTRRRRADSYRSIPSRSRRRHDVHAYGGRRIQQSGVVCAESSEVVPEGEGGSEVDGVERAKLGRPKGGGACAYLLVKLDERAASHDAPRPPDRAAADATGNPLHLDLRHHARHALRPRAQSIAKRPGLGLGYDELHQGGGVQVEECSGHRLRAVLAEFPEGVGSLGRYRPPG